MEQRSCKIIFTLFALMLLFLSWDSVDFKKLNSMEQLEKASQSETVLKNNEPRLLVWILPEETLLKTEYREEKPILQREDFFLIRLFSLIYPVGILAPPSFFA